MARLLPDTVTSRLVQAQLTRSEDVCQGLKAEATRARAQLEAAAERPPSDGTTAAAEDTGLAVQVLPLRLLTCWTRTAVIMSVICWPPEDGSMLF